MQDPELYKQIGELTGRFNTFETNMERQFQELKQTIREQSVVPYQVYEKHVAESRQDIDSLKTRVDTVEDALKIRDASVTGKLSHFMDNAIVKAIGTSLILGVALLIYINYKTQIDSITEKIDNVSEQQDVQNVIKKGY